MRTPAETDPRPAGTIWMLNLDEPIPAVAPLVEVAFQRAGDETLPALAAALGEEALPEIRQRLETGRQCTAAWTGDELAAYGWVSFEEEFIGELNLRVRLLPGEAYIWDCVTLPAFRRKHLYSALLVHLLGELRAGPNCRAWIGADKDNVASQRGFARAGFHPVADLIVDRISGRRLARLQAWPGVPDSLVADARRVYLDSQEPVWLDPISAATRGR